MAGVTLVQMGTGMGEGDASIRVWVHVPDHFSESFETTVQMVLTDINS